MSALQNVRTAALRLDNVNRYALAVAFAQIRDENATANPGKAAFYNAISALLAAAGDEEDAILQACAADLSGRQT